MSYIEDIDKKYKSTINSLSKKVKSLTKKNETRVGLIEKHQGIIYAIIDCKQKHKSIYLGMATEINNIERKYSDLIRDEKLFIRAIEKRMEEAREEVYQHNKKINTLRKERLADLSVAKKNQMINEFGFVLEMGEIYNVDFNKIKSKDLFLGDTKLKVGQYATDSNFTMEIVGETNLRYKIKVECDGTGSGFKSNMYRQSSRNLTIQMNKDSLMEFLNEHSQAMKRKRNLKNLLDIKL